MADATVVAIVEGHGETEALPVLLRRIAAETKPELKLTIPKPIRRSRYRLLQEGELEKDIELAAEKFQGDGAILILLDSEGGCPADLGPEVSQRAKAARRDRKIYVAIAHQEYECWFVAAAPSISGKRGLADGLIAPDNPEAIQGAKEWLRNHMPGTRTYSETVDQAALSQIFDLTMARKAKSFDRFFRVCEHMFQQFGA